MAQLKDLIVNGPTRLISDVSINGDVNTNIASGIVKSDNGKLVQGPNFGSVTTTYLRNDGTWATPVGTTPSDGKLDIKINGSVKGSFTANQSSNATVDLGSYLTSHQAVTLASGTNNGSLKLTVNGTATDNIAVKGLGSAAYTASSAYATASHAHGNITSGGDITATAPTIASGDKLIINDESESKITNGPSFGTSTTQYLANNGTWQTVPTVPSAGSSASAVSSAASGGSATTWSKSDHVHSITVATGDSNGQVKIAGQNASVKGLGTAAYVDLGAANGAAQLGSDGKVPSAQLPSYVDDVLEYDSKSAFPTTGESGKIYIAKDTNLTYRWSGSAYVEISPSLALGETSSTAYAGDKGKANATNIAALQTSVSSLSSNKLDKNTSITAATKCKITYDAKGLVTAGADLTESDIPSLSASKITSGTFADARIASASTWNAKENASNKVSAWSTTPTDTNYPSEKLVKAALDGKAASSHTHSYAGSSSAGGAATSANKVNAAVTFNNSGSGADSGTTFDGSAAKTISYNTIGAAASSHTHSYAGSSSAGGAATSANKLNTNAGSATQPVYFTNGVPTTCTYTLGKSVPSNAVFTDTDTKVTNTVTTATVHYLTGTTSTTTNTGTQVFSTNVKVTPASSGATLETTTVKVTDFTTTKINGVAVGSSPKFTDTNTTYTFAGGTNKFTVTPSGGSAQEITITPSITNNVTGSGTNGYIAKWNGANSVTNGPAIGTNTAQFLNNKGEWAVPPDTQTTAGATNSTVKLYIVGTTAQSTGTSYSNSAVYEQNGVIYGDGAGLSNVHAVAADSATSAGKLGSTSAGSATQPVYFSNGVPAATTYSLNASVPSGAVFTDEKSKTTVANTTKAYIAGSSSASTSTDSTLYKDTGVYLTTTSGQLHATTMQVGGDSSSCTLQYDTTNKKLTFNFT